MTKIIIVAGGLATRMRPITEEIPKCMVDVNGKPFIQHQLEFFRKNGFVEIIFCVAHLADKVQEYFKDGQQLGLKIQYVQEKDELLGTAGSVKQAEKIVGNDEEFIVFYGDSLTSMDFNKFVTFHKKKKALATICMRPLPDDYQSSSIVILDSKASLDSQDKVKVLLEKPTPKDIEAHMHERGYINSGIYVFSNDIFKHILPNQKVDFAKQLFPKLVEKDLGIYGYVTEEFFREVGTIKKYETFLAEVSRKENLLSRNKAVFLDRDGTINMGSKDLVKSDQFVLIEGVAEAIKKIKDAGYLAIIVTNQPVIAKGLCTFKAMEKIHQKMKMQLAEKGTTVDGIYVCPHHPQKGFVGEVQELKISCECRKPKPGMLLKAIQEHNIDPGLSWMVGDSYTDIACGKAVNIKTILVTSGGGSGSADEKDFLQVKPDFIVKNLCEASLSIINYGGMPL